MVHPMVGEAQPFGVKILAVLEVVSATLTIFLGDALLILLVALSYSGHQLTSLGSLAAVVGGVLFVTGFLRGVLAILIIGPMLGLWRRKSWLWSATLILTVFGAAISILELAWTFLGIILDVIVLICLFRADVKQYFGQAESTVQPQNETQGPT